MTPQFAILLRRYGADETDAVIGPYDTHGDAFAAVQALDIPRAAEDEDAPAVWADILPLAAPATLGHIVAVLSED